MKVYADEENLQPPTDVYDVMYPTIKVVVIIGDRKELVETNANMRQIKTAIDFVKTLEEYNFDTLRNLLRTTIGCKFEIVKKGLDEVFIF